MGTTPTPIPTFPISIYPETWHQADEAWHQAFGLGLDETAIAGAILFVVATAVVFLIKRIRRM